MLDLERVDLEELCMALEDNSPEHSWWLEPRSGELEFFSDVEGAEDPEERGLVFVDPIGSDEAYSDMEEFASAVADRRAGDLLLRALAGRGAFRRFKDTLLEFPDLRESWFAFHDLRMRRRAIEWLSRVGLVALDVAERAIADLPDPEMPAGSRLDAPEVARAVADDLAELYGDRLRAVILFGSWARGDGHPESDIDLLVVLDEVGSRREELARMSDVLWRHSLEHDTVVTEIPVSESEYRESQEPLLVRARSEGVAVA